MGAAADPLQVLPGLGYDASRFEQHPEPPQGGIDAHGVCRLNAVPLHTEAVPLLDAAFRIQPVAAHVPLPHRAIRAGHRVGSAHNPHDQVAWYKPAVRWRFTHPPERLVSEDESLLPWGRTPIEARDDVPICATDSDGQRLDQDRPVTDRRFGNVVQAYSISPSRNNGQSAHERGLLLRAEAHSGFRGLRPPSKNVSA
jgi:hypothetical protein